MKTLTVTNNEKNYSGFIHLSLLSKYFIPFGNYIFPLVLWGTKKNESSFIDYNGKQALNFQLSMLLYSVTMLLIAIPTLLATLFSNFTWSEIENGNFVINESNFLHLTGFGIFGIICCGIFGLLKIAEFFYIIYAAVKSNNGEYVEYPLTLKFIK
jgi:uncharacterized protein